MWRSCVALAVTSALLVSACAKSDDEDLRDWRQTICNRAVHDGATVAQVADEFGAVPVVSECRAGLPPLVGDTCGDHSQALCRNVWQWTAIDRSLCNVALGYDACDYTCETYSSGTSLLAPGDRTVCAAKFAWGQLPL